jgi:peptide/nickel transport system substrate-binding protein
MTTDTGDGYTRRSFLRAAAGAVAVGATGIPALGSVAQAAAATPKPKRGGTLRIGMTGGGTSDTIDADQVLLNTDSLRVWALYNSLLAFDKNAQMQLSLAEEFTPNAKATEWTIRLRPGVTFHNGKDLTADDVLFTFQRIWNPKKPLQGANYLERLDLANAKKLDKLTLRIPCHTPFGYFDQVQPNYHFFIVPVGYDPRHPIGTGPFKFKSFTPGQQSVFVRNENYWQPNVPYVDEVIITDYPDETSQLNALNSGEVDIIDQLTGSSVPIVESAGGKIVVSNGQLFTPFTMRMDQAPFNDVRVRQAFRLVVDRPQMRQLLFNGDGVLGNDLYCPFDKQYNHALPQRHQDIEQAKSLLKAAGHSNLSVTLISVPIAAGTLQAAQIFAQQASKAGIKVNIKQITVTELYGPNYLKWTFAQDIWNYDQYILTAQNACLPKGVYNECHVNYPPYTKLWQQLSETTNQKLQTEITHEMQSMEYSGLASGFIIPNFVPSIDACAKNVYGMTPSKTGNPVGGYDLQDIWLA